MTHRTLHTLGAVELIQSAGGDLAVVDAARASFNRRVEELQPGDDKLIQFLMRERHGSPFEHAWFRFRVKAPLFVVREWQRHRTSSYNEESGRYSTLEPEFYYPRHAVRSQVGKPGRYSFERVDPALDDETCRLLADSSVKAYRTYTTLLDKGVAREVARMCLPLNLYTTFVWSVNARALMNFLSLRNTAQAMEEIRDYAQVLSEMFVETMPITADAFHATLVAP